jgi:hypothetical protein
MSPMAAHTASLGEDLFDRIEVGRIFGEEEELGAGRADQLAYGFAVVTAEIVHEDDVACRVGRRKKIERTKRKIGTAAATKAMILKIIVHSF